MSRIYTEAELLVGYTVRLDGDACHHLRNVLKTPLRSEVQLFNNRGQVCDGEIIELSRSKALVKVTQLVDLKTESHLNITLVQSISRGDRMDYTLQKCVEMGVTNIIPIISSRTIVRLDDRKKKSRLKHWAGIIRHATEQSGRTKIPRLTDIKSLGVWLADKTHGNVIILDPLGDMSLPTYPFKAKSVTVVAGPEGGFTDNELAVMKAKKNAPATVSLGPRTLRSETAAVCAISILQALWGDLA